MNMKAIMFAGAGLFASMTATAVWVAGDMADIKAREAAKRAAECAQLAPGGAAPVTGVPTTAADPATGLPADPAVGSAPNPDCAASGGAGASQVQSTDPALAGQIDPATGQPIATDPADESVPVDPGVGLTAPANDPATAVTEFVDPNAIPATTDPASEVPPVDPVADPGVIGTGDGTTF